MQMEIFMKEIGKMIKHMVMVYILILMEQLLKVIGRMINKMEKEKNYGLMVLLIMEIIRKE